MYNRDVATDNHKSAAASGLGIGAEDAATTTAGAGAPNVATEVERATKGQPAKEWGQRIRHHDH